MLAYEVEENLIGKMNMAKPEFKVHFSSEDLPLLLPDALGHY